MGHSFFVCLSINIFNKFQVYHKIYINLMIFYFQHVEGRKFIEKIEL